MGIEGIGFSEIIEIDELGKLHTETVRLKEIVEEEKEKTEKLRELREQAEKVMKTLRPMLKLLGINEAALEIHFEGNILPRMRAGTLTPVQVHAELMGFIMANRK